MDYNLIFRRLPQRMMSFTKTQSRHFYYPQPRSMFNLLGVWFWRYRYWPESARDAQMDCVLIIDGKPDWNTFTRFNADKLCDGLIWHPPLAIEPRFQAMFHQTNQITIITAGWACIVMWSSIARRTTGMYCLRDFPASNGRNLCFIDHFCWLCASVKQHTVLIKTIMTPSSLIPLTRKWPR